MKIYVLGDYGLDNYLIGKVRGISAEVPIPVITVTDRQQLPAMAGNVAANLRTLAPAGVEIVELRSAAHLSPRCECPVKNRLVTEDGQQLARWDEHDTCDPYSVGDLVQLMHADAVVVADYGKGSITTKVVQMLRGVEMPLFVDTKRDPTPWAGSNAILFPNLAECTQFEKEYEELERVVLKGGRNGICYIDKGKAIHRPSLATHVQCVNGAGDTVLAAFTLAALQGMDAASALVFSQAAAAEVVEQPFLQRTTSPEAIYARLQGYDLADAADFVEEPTPTREYTYYYIPSDGPVN